MDVGIRVSKKRVARLMREMGICGVSRRKSTQTTRKAHQARKAPDLVMRDFTVATVNKLWVADITYVPTWSGFLYLSVVMDAFSRRVVGWAMATIAPSRCSSTLPTSTSPLRSARSRSRLWPISATSSMSRRPIRTRFPPLPLLNWQGHLCSKFHSNALQVTLSKPKWSKYRTLSPESWNRQSSKYG